MALYDLEIVDSPRSEKAKKLICSLAGISERDIDDRLIYLPLVVKQSLPLSEAVSIERSLKRLGVSTRLVKVKVEEEEPVKESPRDHDIVETVEAVPVEIADNEIIEIPEDDIKILHPYKNIDHDSSFKQKRVGFGYSWKTWGIFFFVIVSVALVSWYTIVQTQQRQNAIEVDLYISQWESALQQQDMLLDRKLSPQRIFYKLDELESTVERMLKLLRPISKATELRSKFTGTKTNNQNLIKDLIFRQVLEENGYPIHPTCFVDRGMVQGTSDLPESTLLRIKLHGQQDVEANYYAVRIKAGTFRMIIDPSFEHGVFEAISTVASLSQQPVDIQRWAERKFKISDLSERHAPRTARIPVAQSQAESPTASNIEPEKPTIKGGIDLGDPGNDRSRGAAIEKNLGEWSHTIVTSQQHNLVKKPDVLEEIYLRLLDLEVRINQLMGLMESTIERNGWIERREEVYGEYIGVRQEINQLYDQQPKESNPFRMEGRIRNFFQSEGLNDAEVLVVDSPGTPNSFVIDIEVSEGDKERIFFSVAKIVSNEIRHSRLDIDHVSLRYEGHTLRWPSEQILQAADYLSQDNGVRRCVTMMDLSATSHTLP